MYGIQGCSSPNEGRDTPTGGVASRKHGGCDRPGSTFTPGMDKLLEIDRLHECLYEESQLFLVLRERPDSEAELAETRERIIRIYNRIKALS